MKRVTLESYKKDKYYPRIVRAVTAILETGDVVTPVDVFVRMDLLGKADVEAWRMGRVPYLEKVIRCNLEKASRILRILKMHAEHSKMKPSQTDYRKWGKGPKVKLRFSKYGVPAIEEAYSRHFLCPPRKKRSQEAGAAQEEPSGEPQEVPTEIIDAVRLPPGELESP
ncbi:MAG TPA: hypothetical protein VEW48_24765 [Thermoanaerobaculia bacterium]|nr:hypothetical protein [Thermoanaerobaculia bacterium]